MAANQPYNPFPPGPPPQPAAAAAPQGNGLAVAGMVLGIVGLVLCWVPYVGAVVALIGVILSALGVSRANAVGKGKGMALAGLICSVLGIVAGAYLTYAVTTAFTKYVGKAKAIEGALVVNRIGTSAKTYYFEHAALPPSAAMLPGDGNGACNEPGRKWAPVSTWGSDPGWSALDFEVSEPTPFSYRYTKIDDTTALIEAVGDADCDGTLTKITGRVTIEDGSPTLEITGE